MEQKLKELPTMAYTFSQPIEFRMAELIEGVGSRSDVVIKIFGEDLDELREQADRTAKAIAKVNGVADLKVQPVSGQGVAREKTYGRMRGSTLPPCSSRRSTRGIDQLRLQPITRAL